MENKFKWFGGIAIAILVLSLASLAYNYKQDSKASLAEAEKTALELEASKKQWQEDQTKTSQALDALLGKVDALAKESAENAKKTAEANTLLEKVQAEKDAELKTQSEEIARLREELKNPTAGVSTVVGEILDNLWLNDAVNFVVDDQDVPELIDGTIEFDGTDYDVHEEFRSVTGKLVLGTSLTEDDEFSGTPRLMVTDRQSLVYSFVFDEPVSIADISDEEPLSITLLGQPMEFVKVTASQATIRSGEEVVLFEGQETTVNGKTVTLVIVGDGAAYVKVGDSTKVIKEFRSETVGGVDIRVEDILSNEDGPGMATLVLGTDTIYRQNNNDDFFDDENFVFKMTVIGGELKEITVSHDEKLDKVDGERAALGLGQELCFPNGFLCVKFDSLENTDYVEFSVAMDEFDEELVTEVDVNTQCAVITTEDKNIEIGTTEEVSEIYACVNNKVYYQDTDGDWFEVALTSAKLVNDEAKYSLAMGPGSSLRLVEPTGDYVELDTDFTGERLGSLEDEAESTDVKYNSINVGEREYDVLTLFGTVIVDVETNADNDEVVVKIPSDRVEANVLVYSQ